MQIADIWSSGVILYAMLFGKYPFDAQQRNFARDVVNAQYSIPQVCMPGQAGDASVLHLAVVQQSNRCCLWGRFSCR